MNVKAYTPAKHKVFFLSLWFILFAGIILGIMLLFTRPVNKADAAYRQLLLLENQLVRLNAMNNELLVHFDQEDDLFSSGRNRFESEMSKLADEITITLEQLKRTGFLRKKRALSRAMHDLSELFSDYRKNLNDLLATLRERGNEGSGLLSRWQKLSDGMLKAAAGTDENTIIQLQNIKQLEYKYMIRKESRILGEVSDMAEDIRGRIMAVEGGIQVSDLDNYIGLTSSLISLNKRLYDSAGKGIQEITKKSYDTLVLALEKGDRVFLNRMERARLHESIVKYLVLAAFVTFAIFLAIMIVRAMITAPLEGIMASVQKLAAGDLSDAEIKPGRLPELIAIKEFLLQAIRGFQEKLSFTRSINQGSLDISLADLGKADDLGRELVGLQQKLVEDAKEQTKNNEENLRRRYINEGLAKFADILRGKSNDIELLGDSFIREMVK
jgi:methyl-accepting chemotaxis protein